MIGTRPEAIKLAPLILKLRETPWAEVEVLVTGQHRDLVDPMLTLFGIQKERDLALMRPGQSLNDLAASLLKALDVELARSKPALVLAQGDTTTVLAASIASYYRKISFGHVEAGLRSGNLDGPFPEEGNRIVTSHLSSLHFAPTFLAQDNLLREGIDPAKIFVTGNTVIDALLQTAQLDVPIGIDLDATVRLILITAHRRDNHGNPIHQICQAVVNLHNNHPDLHFLWPLHPNPAIGPVVKAALAGLDRVHLVKPLGYASFVSAMKRSYLILTDSGGVQEEAPALAKPVLVLREQSERPEAIASGLARLVGTDPQRIVAEVERLLGDPAAYSAMAGGGSPYGDGHASERTVEAIARYLHVES